ncbi:alpha/beta fold hydrolase [Ottowia thiooxydans]|uniref:alpha/beta fold hydrolase n=1 Tax=Ottowia thiooxydans TaxID=219182 RepID=UPI00048BC638|nr:alpha/beta fold hydrolase [Ottowia thiooxydans]
MTMSSKSSRRVFLATASAAAAACLPSTAGAATNAAKVKPLNVRHSTGFVSDPSTYYEVIEPTTPSNKPPVIMIHGGAHTGSCYMTTADGRPGWAYAFAAKGYKVIVPDWAGTGRSGYVPFEDLTGEMVVRGLGNILKSLDRPAVVMTHSMSGPFGWKLLELYGDRIASLVAIAPGGPGNISAPIEFISETPEHVEVRFLPGAPSLKLSRKQAFVAEAGWAKKKLIGTSTRFPQEYVNAYLATLTVIPQRLLLERVNFAGSAPVVKDFTHYKGKKVALVMGTDDADHTVAVDKPIVDWLNQNGAKADFVELRQHGVVGNGHMMMLESNSNQLANGIVSWLETGKGGWS